MARKSNKTSHVLHLLAGEEPVPETPEEQEKTISEEPEKPSEPSENSKPQENAPAPSSNTPNISIISTGNSEGDPLADLIKDQLEEDFPEEILNSNSKAPSENIDNDDETDTLPPQPDVEDNSKSSPSDSTDHPEILEILPDSLDAAPDDLNVQTDSGDVSNQTDAIESSPSENVEEPAQSPLQNESATVSDESAPNELPGDTDSAQPSDNHTAPTDDSTDSATPETNKPPLSRENLDAVLYPPEGEEVQNYRFVNVMEYIIKDMVIDYMKKFDMCTCERCVVDTTALALTYCSAKYIVVDKHTVSPLLNYYANRYIGDVTVELTKACIQVKDRPRH